MLNRLLLAPLLGLAFLLGLAGGSPLYSQVVGIIVDQTPVIGGTTGQCLYRRSNGTVGAQACSTSSVSTFSAGSTGLTPSTGTAGAVTLAGILTGANGGTGVANTGKTITLGGNLVTTGAFSSTFAASGAYTYTLPGLSTTLAGLSGALTVNDIPVATAAGTIGPSGVQLLTTLSGRTLWGNNNSTTAAPTELFKTTLGNGTAAAPTYSFGPSTGTGMYSPQTDYVGLSAGGVLGFQVRSTNATAFFEIIYNNGMHLRVQPGSGTNVDANLAALGTGNVLLLNNGSGTNSIMWRATPGVAAGTANNYMKITTAAAGSGPQLQPVAQATGDSNIDLNFDPAGTGKVASIGYFHSMRLSSVVAGVATQAFVKASNGANLGVYYGTGDPAFSAAKGSLYVKTDATTTTTRIWVNTDGSTTWAFVITSSSNDNLDPERWGPTSVLRMAA